MCKCYDITHNILDITANITVHVLPVIFHNIYNITANITVKIHHVCTSCDIIHNIFDITANITVGINTLTLFIISIFGITNITLKVYYS